jgi:uncharacterized lipoprotein YddW (UPF0748 family)
MSLFGVDQVNRIAMSILSSLRSLLRLSLLSLAGALPAFSWQPSNESVPQPQQEFRAAWIASVHNLDWPSKSGMSVQAQQGELIRLLNTCAQLRLNAVFLQVRPNSDALYRSSLEPWSQWLSGPGVDPGYDPLAFAITQAHLRGIELHAWINPFRAKANLKHQVGGGHIALRHPEWTKPAGSILLLDPGIAQGRSHVLKVIMDIVSRYDIDGIHLDDYFYPYPPAVLRDGKSNAQRRAFIDSFVEEMYSEVKSKKPWVRVGISPFGIWRPGVPAGIEAGVDAYEHLACDARKWLTRGWVDYLAPQLYWRCVPQKQSFPALMQWWAAQNPSRPIFPGIATARIQSSEDPGRPASEIDRQIRYSRSLARNYPGQCFWSIKSIAQNRGGIQSYLQQLYPDAAVPPAMPWSGSGAPGQPSLHASDIGKGVAMQWSPSGKQARKWAVQARFGSQWKTICLVPGAQTKLTLPNSFIGGANAIAVRGISPFGSLGPAGVVTR